MRNFRIEVVTEVEVILDDTKFDQPFFEQFNQIISDLGDNDDRNDALCEHAKFLAYQHVQNGYDGNDFVEGYGPLKDMGISLSTIATLEEIISGGSDA